MSCDEALIVSLDSYQDNPGEALGHTRIGIGFAKLNTGSWFDIFNAIWNLSDSKRHVRTKINKSYYP